MGPTKNIIKLPSGQKCVFDSSKRFRETGPRIPMFFPLVLIVKSPLCFHIETDGEMAS
jgi:hypothetical protein